MSRHYKGRFRGETHVWCKSIPTFLYFTRNQMSKRNIRKCRFVACKHETKNIDIDNESYVKDGTCYYHEDCFKLKQTNEWKDEKTRADLKAFRDLWYQRISKTVNYSQLMRILNDYIVRGISSDYLLFTLRYCLDHKMNLNYPNGFKYYVDRADIKKAYDKYLLKNSQKKQTKVDTESIEDNSPKFNVQTKPKGFQSILGKS